MREDSLAKLNTLLGAISGNPFYENRLGGLSSVSSLEEFAERVPFTTKAELAQDQKDQPPYGTNLTYPLERYCRFHQTSGTSGQPMIWLDDREGWEWLRGNWEWVWQTAGVTAGKAAIFPFSFGPFLGFWAGFESAVELGIRAIPAGGLTSESRVALMERLRPEVLCCTPTYGLHLARVAGEARRLGVEKIIVAGEPGGSLPQVRARGFSVTHALDADTDARDRAEAVLDRVGLKGRERVNVRSLSYGERRALEIGVALATEPRLLFVDEPTAGLGTGATARLAELIGELKRHTTIVMIEHDMRFLFSLADRISVIHWGQVIAEGTPEELRENPWVRRSNLGGLA